MRCSTGRPMYGSGDFMSTTMKSAVHVGREYQQNLIACRNTNFEEIKTLFDITLKLIVENSFETLNLSSMIHNFSPWMRSTLCHDQVVKWSKAKVHVYSDSVLCLGNMYERTEANARWKDQLQDFQQSSSYRLVYTPPAHHPTPNTQHHTTHTHVSLNGFGSLSTRKYGHDFS